MPIGGYVAIAFVIVILLILSSCIKIVPQAQAYVVERLGAYQGTWSVGIHFKVPFIDKVAKKNCNILTGFSLCLLHR